MMGKSRLLEWIVLGSGCFAPDADAWRGSRATVRNPAGYALRYKEETLIFDLGFGNFRQLFRAGIDPASISHAFFTHRHPDHVGDLPALLFYFREQRPKVERLNIYGPRGFERFFFRLTRAHHPWLGPRGFELKVRDLENGEGVAQKHWAVSCIEVPHSTESIAYRFESKEGSICYSGDTGFYPGLAAFAREADIFTVECTLPDQERETYHLQVSQALELLRASNAKRGVLSHLSGDSLKGLNKKIFGTRVKIAQDLMRIKLR